MKILDILGISGHDYNMLLLELGCLTAEELYPPENGVRNGKLPASHACEYNEIKAPGIDV